MHRAGATHVIWGGSDAIERDGCKCGVSTGGIVDSDGDVNSENNNDNNSSDDDGDNGSDSPLRFVVKHCNALTVVEARSLRFLDVTNYIAPGLSYKRYVRADGCEVKKVFSPTS